MFISDLVLEKTEKHTGFDKLVKKHYLCIINEL